MMLQKRRYRNGMFCWDGLYRTLFGNILQKDKDRDGSGKSSLEEKFGKIGMLELWGSENYRVRWTPVVGPIRAFFRLDHVSGFLS
jgi:hypothetical protein